MRKILLAGLLFLGAFAVYGQTGIGTAGQQEYARALTNAGKFGVTRYTTALLPTCNTGNLGALAYDTTAAFTKVCNGSAWAAVATGAPAGTITSGATATSGCTAGGILHSVSDFVVCSDADFTVSGATATITNVLIGDGTAAAPSLGFSSDADGTGTGFYRSAANTLAFTSNGGLVYSTNTNTTAYANGTRITMESGLIGLNYGSGVIALGSIATLKFGNSIDALDLQIAREAAATLQMGADVTSGSAVDQMLKGADTTTATDQAGSDFTLGAGRGTGTGASSVIIQAPTPLATGTTAQTLATIATFKDSGTSGTSRPQLLMPDGVAANPAYSFTSNTSTGMFYDAGQIWIDAAAGQPVEISVNGARALTVTASTAIVAGNALTVGTMATDLVSGAIRTAISSYTWTNAQVVALGATTTGDITVATLPAKTRLKNAYVVITGAAAGPATVTVSCGDAIGGTPFINYVVPSDAKAAANTVYGDVVAERGTSIDVEWYYLPSYTATTLVTCHFISTGANLDTVTASTGRVVLETELVP